MIKDSAKTILCYGDSNTWGQIPRSPNRHPRSVRWPSVLQNLLGDDFEVINEGLRGRDFADGLKNLPTILNTNSPIDTVIVMLGTNDVFDFTPEQISQNLEKTIQMIQNKNIRNILIICPPHIINAQIEAKSDEGKKLDEMMELGIEPFKKLASLYKNIAQKHECHFLDAENYIRSSSKDGYHLDVEAHIKLAEIVRDKLL